MAQAVPQGLKRAEAVGDDAVIAFVERMVRRKASADEGLHPLKAANRRDLTIEAIVLTTAAPYGVFDSQVVEEARERLAAFQCSLRPAAEHPGSDYGSLLRS